MRRCLAALVFALLLPLPVLAGQVTVKPGETLSEIAERYGVSLSRLMQLNGISKADHVEVGQVLKLPGNASGSSVRNARATGTVRVQEGDTLSEIASRQGMSLSQLMALNGISKADHVEVGQVLKVTGKVPAAGPSYRRGATFHVVKSGESLSEIAEGYGVAINRLVAINQLEDPDHVEVGRRLKLQGPAPTPRPAVVSPTPRRVQAASRPVAETAAVSQATEAAASASRPAAERIVSRSTSPDPAVVATASAPSATVPSAAIQPTTKPINPAIASESAGPAATVALNSGSTSVLPARTTPTPVRETAIRPSSTPAATPAATAVATPAASRTDWRRYGPLQVDWSGWQPMGGSLVAPVMNAKGDTLYLAINCGARKLNATSVEGDWRTWDNPQADFEQKLVNDLCRSRGG